MAHAHRYIMYNLRVRWGYSSVGRALPLQGRCQRFESAYLHKNFQMLKKLIACEGSLGIQKRWRTRLPAKRFGELEVSFDPEVSEWGNSTSYDWIYRSQRANLGNWNILVPRGKESKNDSLSSGERNGNSLNFSIFFEKGWGVERS
jgi:hypothetical protein